MASIIIHSGLFPDLWNASMTFNRFVSFFPTAADVVLLILTCRSSHKALISTLRNNSRIASAPIPTLKELAPYSSTHSRYLSSVKSSLSFKFVLPVSKTTYASKYRIFSNCFKLISKRMPIRLGTPLRNQM